MAKDPGLSKEEIEQYQQKLIQQLEILNQNITNLRNAVTLRSQLDASGDITTIPTHIADISNDALSHDITLGLMRNEVQVIREIEEALVRIKQNKYGVCEQCQKPIAKKRLDYVPYTRLCIYCKTEQEKRQRRDTSDW